jgi:hypothetical protein
VGWQLNQSWRLLWPCKQLFAPTKKLPVLRFGYSRRVLHPSAVRVALVVVGLGRAAHADPTNLLAHRSTTINVGSTVANRAIKPQHLVDGKLDTAWNSRTGDLVGAWLVVRLPADAKVQSIKLTAGFTKVDPKLGDLFTENPRIKKLRITHDQTVVEKELDIANRGLQEIAITGGGGDYKIEVLAVEMGTKKDWRETCISELEVWGTADPKRMFDTRPDVYVDSFSPPPLLDEADCQTLLGPANVSATATLLSDAYGVCEMVTTVNPHDPFDQMTHELTLVALPEKKALPPSITITTQIYEGLGAATDSKLDVAALSVGDDQLLITAVGSSSWNNLPDSDQSAVPAPKTAFAVYRATKAGLVDVLDVQGKPGCVFSEAAMPSKNGKSVAALDFTCGTTVKSFRWTGSKYVKR